MVPEGKESIGVSKCKASSECVDLAKGKMSSRNTTFLDINTTLLSYPYP